MHEREHCATAQVFFCKYNDPIYVKLEKLDIMIALANERNIDQVLLELKEYATEVDVDFVRKVCFPGDVSRLSIAVNCRHPMIGMTRACARRPFTLRGWRGGWEAASDFMIAGAVHC